MLVTRDVSQPLMSWSNAELNARDISVTREVSHLLMSWSNGVERNIQLMVVTCDVSHELKLWLNADNP